MFTKDFFHYLIKLNEFDTNHDCFNFTNSSFEIQNNFPSLTTDYRFHLIKQHKTYAFTIIDSYDEWLCVVPDNPGNEMPGLNYAIKSDRLLIGWKFNTYNNEIIISSIKPCYFYSIRRFSLPNEQYLIQMAPFACDSGFVANSTERIIIKDFQNFCFDNDEHQEISLRKEPCNDPVQFDIIYGLNVGGKFYLFSNTYVYSFDETVLSDSNDIQQKSVMFKNQTYSSFFKCEVITTIPPVTIEPHNNCKRKF